MLFFSSPMLNFENITCTYMTTYMVFSKIFDFYLLYLYVSIYLFHLLMYFNNYFMHLLSPEILAILLATISKLR